MKFHLLSTSNWLSIILSFKLSLSILVFILFTHVSYSQIENPDEWAMVTLNNDFTSGSEKNHTITVKNTMLHYNSNDEETLIIFIIIKDEQTEEGLTYTKVTLTAKQWKEYSKGNLVKELKEKYKTTKWGKLIIKPGKCAYLGYRMDKGKKTYIGWSHYSSIEEADKDSKEKIKYSTNVKILEVICNN